MACDKPTGDCTKLSPCGNYDSDCGCGDDSGSLPLPKCQDVSLVPGAYQNATVVVNADGCISSVATGEAPFYTPDDCCGGESSGTGGTGARGPKGDPGPSATVTVDPIIVEGSGTSWTVQNIGTTSAAIFKFTAPAGGGDDCCPSGFTGSLCGFQMEDGVVKQIPSSLVTSLEVQTSGEYANQIVFTVGQNATINDQCGLMLTLNLDALYYKIKEYIDNENIALQQKIDSNAYGVGVNGSLAYNSSSADKIVTIKRSDGTTIATVTVPANGSVTLPDTNGETYFVYSGSNLLGAYKTAEPTPP